MAPAVAAVLMASSAALWIGQDGSEGPPGGPVGPGLRPLAAPAPVVAPPTTRPRPPSCRVADGPVTGDPNLDWATVVVDTARALPLGFVPPSLVGVDHAGFDTTDLVRLEVIADLGAMRSAAAAAGAPFVVASGYRSGDYQRDLFARRVAEVGLAEASLRSARPGHSEHQLGTAVDVLDPGSTELTAAFAFTPAGIWVAAHAHEFGFVVSYPAGSRDRTCYEFEPWHLRYVGRPVAAAIHRSRLTPREWMLTRADDPA